MIDKLAFGQTGHMSTRTIFGAAAFMANGFKQYDADKTMELVLEHGINHIDTAATYGESEVLLVPFLKQHRKEVFLATKTGEREYQAAKDQIHKSLERMQVDSIDLIQLHNLVDKQEWETALGPKGALEAAIEAKEEGLVKFIGVTGHGLSVAARHFESLQVYDFDAVLLPYSYVMMQLEDYATDFEKLYALCSERNIAMQTIKAITKAPWGDKKQTHATWYEPLSKQSDIDAAVHWVLARDTVFLNTVGDINLLPLVFDAAKRFTGKQDDSHMEAVFKQQQMQPLFTS